ncbi:MAG: DUF4133 domain-containing protein [Ferruginibacter sp.]
MANSVYQVNKGINKSIEFKGLKAQYIWWLGGGIVGLLVLFAVLYIVGLNTLVCLAVIAIAGTLLFIYIYHLSNTHGEYGMMKRLAGRSIPRTIKSTSRRQFFYGKKTGKSTAH